MKIVKHLFSLFVLLASASCLSGCFAAAAVASGVAGGYYLSKHYSVVEK